MYMCRYSTLLASLAQCHIYVHTGSICFISYLTYDRYIYIYIYTVYTVKIYIIHYTVLCSYTVNIHDATTKR